MNKTASTEERLIRLTPQELNLKLKEFVRWQLKPEKGHKPDFSNHDLRGIDLQGQNLYQANFTGANLWEANFQNANLTGAQFQEANLCRANLQGVTFKETNFSGANLEEALFGKADFQDVDFSKANLSKADFSEANLINANLSHANLKQANLKGAKLGKADLTDAILIETDFSGAWLNEANLKKADLRSASLEKALLKKAVLTEANLTSAGAHQADFSQADLRDAQLENARLYGANLIRADLTRANLSNTGLEGANLNQANLTEAILTRTNLESETPGKAIFREVNFTRTDLTDACLMGSDLSGANFHDAILHRANLTRSKTAGTKFGGADVTNADLPEEIKTFDSLKNIEEASKIARKHFSWLLVGLAFSGLTLASTNDVQLLTNSQTSSLPIIQTKIPLAGFYLVAPLFLFGLFVYFQLQLQHQWRLIARLPGIFPDGIPLHEKTYPWLLNTWVSNFFPRIKGGKTLHSIIRNFLVVSLTWYATPLFLFAFWSRYITRHDWLGTRIQIILFVLSLVSAISLHFLAKRTLRGRTLVFWKPAFVSLGFALIFLAITSTLSFKAIEGDLKSHNVVLKILPWGIPSVQPAVFPDMAIPAFLVRRLQADFSQQDVSVRPENYDPEDAEERKLVRGARLENSNLNYVSASQAFMVNTKLDSASLKGADLSQAHLAGAFFKGANLKGANLSGAELQNTDFSRADLQNANLKGARLINANLSGALLTNADLADADLSGADFSNVFDLKEEQIKSAINWKKANFDIPFKIRLGMENFKSEKS